MEEYSDKSLEDIESDLFSKIFDKTATSEEILELQNLLEQIRLETYDPSLEKEYKQMAKVNEELTDEELRNIPVERLKAFLRHPSTSAEFAARIFKIFNEQQDE